VSPAARLVIADDDVLMREGIASLLTEAGFDVVGRAGDADDFIRKAPAHRPDAAIVDVEMPPGRGATKYALAVKQVERHLQDN
jgi:DNA-binding NarL/FixJ family response regulator